MGTAQSTQRALQQIDHKEGGIDRYVDRLFHTYDRDGSGMLEGQEAQMLIDGVTEYVIQHLRREGHNFEYAAVRTWVQHTLDSNNDGRLSRNELHCNLKVVLKTGEGACSHHSGDKPL